jgi:hypothetical protein
MKLGTYVLFGAAGFGSLLLATALSVEGCSSSNSTTPTADGGGSSSGAGLPPASPTSGTTPATTNVQNFALQKLHLGDETATTGLPGWEQYGYNLDGLDTNTGDTNVCKPVSGAAPATQKDGPNGIDNSFGENILPLLMDVGTTSTVLDQSIAAGKFTLMLDVTGLDTTTTQNSTGLSGQLFGSVYFNQPPNSATSVPTFTTADNWPLSATYITSGIADGGALAMPVTSNVVFTNAYISDGTFVNGGKTTVTLSLTVDGTPFSLVVNAAILTFKHSATTAASGGIIAGVLNAQDLVTSVSNVAGDISSSLCSGPTLASIQQKILQAADIMADGTNGDNTKTCDGISIGLGFDAVQIGPPAVVGVPATATNACAATDGGVDGGTGDASPADASSGVDSGVGLEDGGSADTGAADTGSSTDAAGE